MHAASENRKITHYRPNNLKHSNFALSNVCRCKAVLLDFNFKFVLLEQLTSGTTRVSHVHMHISLFPQGICKNYISLSIFANNIFCLTVLFKAPAAQQPLIITFPQGIFGGSYFCSNFDY